MDLQPTILEYLCRYHKVELPGLGTLQWLQNRVKRDRDRFFSPPSLSLQYHKEAGVSEEFISFLAKKNDWSIDHSKSMFDKWCAYQKNRLSQGEAVGLLGLGVFQKKGKEIIFTPTYEDGQIDFETGQVVLETIDHGTFVHPVGEWQPIQREESGWNWLEIILPLILITLIGILLYFLWLSFQPVNPVDPSVDNAVVAVDKDTINNEEEIASLDTSENEVVSGVEEEESEEEEETTPPEEDQEIVQEEEYVEDEVKSTDIERIVRQVQQGECIIVIGSFKNKNLAQKAVASVLEKGMKAYTEGYGDFTRVGVVFDCETQDLYRKLFQLRGDFSDDAWILKYK